MDGARRGGVRGDYTSLGDALARYNHARYFTGPGQAGKARAALWWLFLAALSFSFELSQTSSNECTPPGGQIYWRRAADPPIRSPLAPPPPR